MLKTTATFALLLSATTALAQPRQQPTAPLLVNDPFSALPAAAFQDSIGICTHLGYDSAHGWGANAYGDFTGKVIPALQYLGAGKLKKLRDTFAYSYYYDKFQQINQQFGITFTLYAGTGPGVDFASGIAWVKANPKIVTAVEGTNESDNWPSIFGGMQGPSATVAEQQAIASNMGNSNTLVYGPSIGNPANLGALGNLSNAAQFTNVHAYPASGQQPGAWLGGWLQQESTATPGQPSVITEGGYSTMPEASDMASVPLDVAAKQILNMLFDAYFDYTVMETDVYELLDEYPDPAGTNREWHFGLFTYDGTPKPSATAVRNLLAIIDDTHGSQAGRLAFTTSGLNGKAVLMVKADGSFLIGVWSEPQIWDDSTHSESPAPTQQVTVAFGESATTANVYDPLIGTDPISTARNVSQVTVEVRDHPIIIQLNGPTGLTTAGLTIPTSTIRPPDPSSGQATPAPVSVSKWDALAQQGAAAAAAARPGETFTAPDGDRIFIPDGGSLQDAVLIPAATSDTSAVPPGPTAPATPSASASATPAPFGGNTAGSTGALTATAVALAINPTPAPTPVSVATGGGPDVYVSSDAALQAAVHDSAPGTTIHVAAGTYSGGLDITANNITVVSDTPGAATIIGGGATANGDMVTLSGNNVTFSGFNVSGAHSSIYSLVTMLGSNDTVANSSIHDLQTGGLLSWGMALGTDSSIKGGSGGQLLNNTVYNVGPPGSTSNTVQGIYVASHNVTVSGNLIHDIASTCVTSWHNASAMTVTYNTCDNAYHGITVGASDGATNSGSVVNYNVVTNTQAPIDQEGSTTPASMTGNVVGQPLSGTYTLTSGSTAAGYTAAPAGQ